MRKKTEEPKEGKLVTIRDVAKLAGVSIATVSRVLHKNQRINQTLAERVQDAIRQLDYRPNPAMAAIASRHFNSMGTTQDVPVAYVVQEQQEQVNMFLKIYCKTFFEHIKKLGYSPELHLVQATTKAASFAKMIYHRGVTGVVLDRLSGDLRFFDQIDWAPFCVVSLEKRLVNPAFDKVSNDVFSSAQQVWEQVAGRGYKRIGFVPFFHPYKNGKMHPDDKIRDAVECQANTTGLTVPSFRFDGPLSYTPPLGFKKWLTKNRPDAIIGFNTVIFYWLKQLGIRCPEDIGFAAQVLTDDLHLDVSGIVERRRVIAQEAADRLDFLFRRGYRGIPPLPIEIHIPGEWHEGKTLKEHPNP